MSQPQRRVYFVPPETMEEAQTRRLELVEKITRIQDQLGDRNRTCASGERQESKEYWQWRQKAKGALRATTNDLRALNAWMKKEVADEDRLDQRAKLLDFEVDPDDVWSCLLGAYGLLKRLAAETDFSSDETAIFDVLRECLRRNKREVGVE